MDRSSHALGTTADVLDTFFATCPMLGHPALSARSRGVRSALESYLDAEAERFLTTVELQAVAAERQSVAAGRAPAHGLVARVTEPEALLCALPGFLEARWPADPSQAKAQVLVVEELVAFLRRLGDPDPSDYSCGYLAAEVQVRRARQELAHPRGVVRLAPVAG